MGWKYVPLLCLLAFFFPETLGIDGSFRGSGGGDCTGVNFSVVSPCWDADAGYDRGSTFFVFSFSELMEFLNPKSLE